MADQNSLGSRGPNLSSIEPVDDTVYSVEGHNFESGFRVEVRDGVGQSVADIAVSDQEPTAFTLKLPYSTPGPYTLTVVNPDGSASTQSFSTPGTSGSNDALRTNS